MVAKRKPTVGIPLRLDPGLKRELERLAADSHRSLNQMIAYALTVHVGRDVQDENSDRAALLNGHHMTQYAGHT